MTKENKEDIEYLQQQLARTMDRIVNLSLPNFYLEEEWDPIQRRFVNNQVDLPQMLTLLKRKKLGKEHLDIIKFYDRIIHTLVLHSNNMRSETEKLGMIINQLLIIKGTSNDPDKPLVEVNPDVNIAVMQDDEDVKMDSDSDGSTADIPELIMEPEDDESGGMSAPDDD